ncbi:uncharacterized protein LOC105210654 [Zeugodacus cucurbitae]|uniref:uncharacterized protein LOC105210654 n=1 Tax=Zeugodacus cucurbitae TaxID=28588 RepID=UPI0023D9631E|nr:uncharacterized protein LOC105210654 [Zeugodacus cucurbitae]
MQTTFVKIISLLALIITHTQAVSYKECKNAAEGTFVAIENDCLSYIYCLGDESFTDLCPVGTYFDVEQQQCAIDDDGSKCTSSKAQPAAEVQQQSVLPAQAPGEYTATTTIGTTTSGLLLPSTLSTHPQCKATVDAYFPYQQRCEYYYRCMSGYLSIQRCSLGYGWDYLQEKCMPLKEAQCFKAARAHAFRF